MKYIWDKNSNKWTVGVSELGLDKIYSIQFEAVSQLVSPMQDQVAAFDRFKNLEPNLSMLLHPLLVEQANEIAASTDTDIPSDQDIWSSVSHIQVFIPLQYNSRNRHVFLIISVDWENEHSFECYLRDEEVSSFGETVCAWQEEGWLKEDKIFSGRLQLELTKIESLGFDLLLPKDWRDRSDTYLPYVASWSKIQFVKKYDSLYETNHGSPQATITIIHGSLPEGVTLNEYRENLAAIFTARNDDLLYKEYSAFCVEGKGCKTLVVNLIDSIICIQIKINENYDFYNALYESIP